MHNDRFDVRMERALDEQHPAAIFQYRYNYDFLTVATGFLKKYNYEPRVLLTSVAKVEQIDDDRFVIYRRQETAYKPDINFEKVIFNRANNTITSELVVDGLGGAEKALERSVLSAEDGTVVQRHLLLDHQGMKSFKMDFFKAGIEKTLKAIKFHQFDQQA